MKLTSSPFDKAEVIGILHDMSHDEQSVPTTAYDLLDNIERMAVDSYVVYITGEQKRLNERILFALDKPIPSDWVRRSKGVLQKAIVRVALREKIQALADEQDLSPAAVIRELTGLARSNMADYLEPNDFGTFRIKDIRSIPREKMAAVKRMSILPTMMGDKVEVVLHDKIVPLNKLAELMGLVSPDKPPVLEEFAKTAKQAQLEQQDMPEEQYRQMLESMGIDR